VRIPLRVKGQGARGYGQRRGGGVEAGEERLAADVSGDGGSRRQRGQRVVRAQQGSLSCLRGGIVDIRGSVHNCRREAGDRRAWIQTKVSVHYDCAGGRNRGGGQNLVTGSCAQINRRLTRGGRVGCEGPYGSRQRIACQIHRVICNSGGERGVGCEGAGRSKRHNLV